MVDKELDKVREHQFDGIQEYDNKLPNWWLGTFVLTVLFGFGYWLYYFSYEKGPSLAQELQQEVSQHEKDFASKMKNLEVSEDELLQLSQNPEALSAGKEIFISNCAACHSADGTGGIGPNLTDQEWIHGGKPQEIFHTISYGVLDKGMLAWKDTLQSAQLKNVAAYVISLSK